MGEIVAVVAMLDRQILFPLQAQFETTSCYLYQIMHGEETSQEKNEDIELKRYFFSELTSEKNMKRRKEKKKTAQEYGVASLLYIILK